VEAVIREYIDQHEGEQREDLVAVYQAIKAVLPDEEERIGWGMPTFGENVIHFAGAKRHVGIYPGPEAVEHFAAALDERGYRHTKGAIQLPYGRVDRGLVSAIALWCKERNG
jgi:uncharacterized protein YdhG (YjbR/CyaY superfamily)